MALRGRVQFFNEPLYLMDGSAFVYRGFYAFQHMSRSDGFPTNVIYIVARLLLRMLREERPHFFSFILDGKGKSFRSQTYAAYKAQRQVTPEPLVMQIEPLLELLNILGIPTLVSEAFEADDYIASIANQFKNERSVVIVGADKDLKQCLDTHVMLWDPAGKDEKLTTLQSFIDETQMQPDSWPDYQALVGDSSDNIPGIPQIGPKTAQTLIADFPKLEDLFDRLAAVPPKLRARLEGQRENAMMYRELTTLVTTACPDITLQDMLLKKPVMADVVAFMEKYELRSLLREVASMERSGCFDTPKSKLPLSSDGGMVSPKIETPARPSAQKTRVDEQKTTVTPKEATSVVLQTSGQKGLFDDVAETSQTTFAECKTIAELPHPASHILVLPHDKGILLASGEWEFVYTGSVDSLQTWFNSLSSTLVATDYKELCTQYEALLSIDISRWFDISLAAYLLNPEERSYVWSAVAVRYGSQADSAYSLRDHPGLFALDVARYIKTQIISSELSDVMYKLELPLAPVLLLMEKRGITIDRTAFSDFLHEVQTNLVRLTDAIQQAAGRTFNIRSSQQLSDVLFTVLGLPQSGKTKGGAMSTSQENLEKLLGKHPIIEDILEYRKLEKLRSTYLEPLPKLADTHDRIHTTLNQTATATGRLSSSNPNLQNIPVRGSLGERMRGCFVAAPGKLLLCADYSQIELRVLAHLSQDPTLLDAFHKDEDIHSRTAGLLYDVDPQHVTPDQRRNAKTINFGLIYGMGAQKLAQELRISMKEAKEFIERYFSRLTKLKEFYDSVEEQAKQYGYVLTMAGRRRFTPDILSQNNQLRSQARRQAINTRIQGSAADVIKVAMLAVEHDAQLADASARLLLQIHDELIVEFPTDAAAIVEKRVTELMRSVVCGDEPFSIPLKVDAGVGHTWAEAH